MRKHYEQLHSDFHIFHPQYSPRNGPWERLAWTQRTLGRVN